MYTKRKMDLSYMTYRSGKVQFLFWAFFFSVLLYFWLIAVGVQTFVLPDEPPTDLPSNVVGLMFILFGLLIVTTLSGNVVAIMIGNKHYTRLFGAMTIIVFGSMIAVKGMYG
jgi:hypothetical protein